MRLSGFTRFLAKNLLGGKTFGEANWNDAARYLERAVAIEPERIVHHVDLAEVYVDRHEKPKAREQYEQALHLTPTDYNDRSYQQQAQRGLSDLP
jgi:Tfp pilus assembly protein PilF